MSLHDYYGFVKTRPCLVRGTMGVDVAHLSAIDVTFLGEHRIKNKLGTSHKGRRGFMCVPLSPDLHRITGGNPMAFHKVGEANFWMQFGISYEEVAWAVALQLAEYLGRTESGS